MRVAANDNWRGDVRFQVEPRLIPPKKAARRLHLTHGEFIAKLRELRLAGFPAACDVTGNYDLAAIDAWLDMRSGLLQSNAGQVEAARSRIKERIAAIGRDKT